MWERHDLTGSVNMKCECNGELARGGMFQWEWGEQC